MVGTGFGAVNGNQQYLVIGLPYFGACSNSGLSVSQYRGRLEWVVPLWIPLKTIQTGSIMLKTLPVWKLKR